eukprot:comp19472_c0_seq1/m.36972 comp19472_c0_seq1/g.36972  ORF comp19472_c0_seq1/g.36972 comp19472_c0_seq1/m.36972 type:complete len:321 (-) comp19472_c0_seq1:139-1101(-)
MSPARSESGSSLQSNPSTRSSSHSKTTWAICSAKSQSCRPWLSAPASCASTPSLRTIAMCISSPSSPREAISSQRCLSSAPSTSPMRASLSPKSSKASKPSTSTGSHTTISSPRMCCSTAAAMCCSPISDPPANTASSPSDPSLTAQQHISRPRPTHRTRCLQTTRAISGHSACSSTSSLPAARHTGPRAPRKSAATLSSLSAAIPLGSQSSPALSLMICLSSIHTIGSGAHHAADSLSCAPIPSSRESTGPHCAPRPRPRSPRASPSAAPTKNGRSARAPCCMHRSRARRSCPRTAFSPQSPSRARRANASGPASARRP